MYKDIPNNTHFEVDVMGSMVTLDEAKQTIWLSMNFQTYVVLIEYADLDAMAARFPDMLKKYVGPELKRFMNMDWDEMSANSSAMDFGIQPLTDIHLHSDLQGRIGLEWRYKVCLYILCYNTFYFVDCMYQLNEFGHSKISP